MSASRVIGPIFYDYTVNAVRYARNILRPFFAEVTEEERLHGISQHDSATAPTAHVSLEALREIADDRVIGRGLWPPGSPHLTACDFYLWGSLKYKVYKTNPHTLEEVRRKIRSEISTISEENLQRVKSLLRGCILLIALGQEGNIFSICCSTGKFLLGFLKIFLTAIDYRLTSFTGCYPSRDTVHGARADERAAATSPSSRKENLSVLPRPLAGKSHFSDDIA
jgi:hypothetical protein